MANEEEVLADVVEPVPQDADPVDEPILEDSIEVEEEEVTPEEPVVEPKVHPLRPGGVRFEQVYKQAKESQRALQQEREKRIVAETLLNEYKTRPAVQPTQEVAAEKEYSWSELEPMIATGQITRADAEAHRESVNKRKIAAEVKREMAAESRTVSRAQKLNIGVSEYVSVLPSLTDISSAERKKADQEFDWLVETQGVDLENLDKTTRKALELTALRNAFGPIDALTKRSGNPRVESAQGIPGGSRPAPRSSNPDQALLDKLTVRQVDHYKRMIGNGSYKGWKEVVEELKYTPGKPKVKK